MRLTKQAIDQFRYEGTGASKDIRWDDELPGFGVRIYPSGKKSFVLFYRTREMQQRFMSIGKYGVLTLDEARKSARITLGKVLEGADPLAEKASQRSEQTVADLADWFLQIVSDPTSTRFKRSWTEDKRRLSAYIRPELGSRFTKSIGYEDVRALHWKVGKHSIYEANRCVSLISAMWNAARIEPNPAKGIEKYTEKKRDRWVTPEELPRIAEAVSKESNVFIRAAFWLYLLTGLRRSELLGAKWEDVDFVRGVLTIPQTKSGRAHTLPLSSGAIALLRQLPRIDGNPFILPGRRAGRPLVNVTDAWERIRAAAKVQDVRIHDLRRTVGSWLAQSGKDLHLIGKVLNHSDISTTQIYARFAQDNVRDALEQHSEALYSVIDRARNAGGNVTNISRPR